MLLCYVVYVDPDFNASFGRYNLEIIIIVVSKLFRRKFISLSAYRCPDNARPF